MPLHLTTESNDPITAADLRGQPTLLVFLRWLG